jgi:hypothetical protein
VVAVVGAVTLGQRLVGLEGKAAAEMVVDHKEHPVERAQLIRVAAGVEVRLIQPVVQVVQEVPVL